MRRFKYIPVFIYILLCLTACKKFEFSPYQLQEESVGEPLNPMNIKRLKDAEPDDDDTITIIFSGDSQRFYNSLDGLIEKANSTRNLDFLILAGDIVDFGLQQEFTWVNQRLSKLHVPYLCVIGNHDLVARGAAMYEAVFGPRNFSFVYKGHKFIFHDTNGREYNFDGSVPNMSWISEQLRSNGARWMVGVSHVPPYNEDFDKNLEEDYAKLLSANKQFILSLHGHLHGSMDTLFYNDHVRYITSYSVDKNTCILLKLFNGRVNKSLLYY